mmetsp:Transcript_21390/g.28088  ORF Transcript_21390/g.28088 Transcript_21390/m.28088 type:complete len:89 (+) Transcript_21390:810-1076(+)
MAFADAFGVSGYLLRDHDCSICWQHRDWTLQGIHYVSNNILDLCTIAFAFDDSHCRKKVAEKEYHSGNEKLLAKNKVGLIVFFKYCLR